MASPVTVAPHKSSLGGLDANIWGLLAYLASGVLGLIPGIKYVAWLAPLVLYFLEKNSSFVKFHAMQAFCINLLSAALSIIVAIIAAIAVAASATSLAGLGGGVAALTITSVLTVIISIVVLVFEIIALVKAYKYQEYEIPGLGNLARAIMRKF